MDTKEVLLKQFTKEMKLKLLKDYLIDDTYVKAIIETLTDEELENWLNINLEEMILKTQSGVDLDEMERNQGVIV